jgi:DNA-binding response OmpR family regulator
MLQPLKTHRIAHAMTHRNQRGSNRDSPLEATTRILIVDDDRGIGTALTFMLAARGYDQVRAVRSARRAVALADQHRPALIFIDLDLPADGALEVARHVTRVARQPGPRLIALTTRPGARVPGFERSLAKPLSQSELDEVLKIPVADFLQAVPAEAANGK